MKEVRLLLIRHGETHGDRFGGDTLMTERCDSPLNEAGLRQAEDLAAALRDEQIVAVFSSPQRQAMETARRIAECTGAPITSVDGLRAFDCGQVVGEAIVSVQHRHPELWVLNESETRDDFGWPGGESYRDLRQRVMVSLEDIARTCIGQTAAVVTHAGAVNQVRGWVAQLPPRFWKANGPESGSITELFWGTRTVRLGRYNVLPAHWCATNRSGTRIPESKAG